MKKLTKILILSIFTLIITGFFSHSALAVAPTVEFENTPLFGEANFMPGSSISRWVKLNNNTNDSHSGMVRALDVVNVGDLGDATQLQIKQGTTILYEDTFSNFFNESEVLLSQIAPGDSTTFDFIVTFDKDSGNEYQNSTIGFTLQAGFEDGDTDTDTIIVGGGGGSILIVGPKNLIITNENAIVIPLPEEHSVITITWDTNILATSQVIYGLTNNGPYNINLSALNLGYPSSTIEQELGKVFNHLVTLSNLPPGDYSYRVVSRASPPTISYEHHFTIPKEEPLIVAVLVEEIDLIAPVVESLVEEGLIEPLTEEELVQANNLLAASAGLILGISNIWFFSLLSFLILLIIFFIIYRRRRKKEEEFIAK